MQAIENVYLRINNVVLCPDKLTPSSLISGGMLLPHPLQLVVQFHSIVTMSNSPEPVILLCC